MSIPIPQGAYLPAVRHHDLVYTSGMTPRRGGQLMFSGKIKCGDSTDQHRAALELAASNALAAVHVCLADGERIETILQLLVYLNTELGFVDHAKTADFASEHLIKRLGPDSIGSRATVGVAALPSDATAEIALIAIIVKSKKTGAAF